MNLSPADLMAASAVCEVRGLPGLAKRLREAAQQAYDAQLATPEHDDDTQPEGDQP